MFAVIALIIIASLPLLASIGMKCLWEKDLATPGSGRHSELYLLAFVVLAVVGVVFSLPLVITGSAIIVGPAFVPVITVLYYAAYVLGLIKASRATMRYYTVIPVLIKGPALSLAK